MECLASMEDCTLPDILIGKIARNSIGIIIGKQITRYRARMDRSSSRQLRKLPRKLFRNFSSRNRNDTLRRETEKKG